MSIDNLLATIRSLNGGTVLPNIEDKVSRYDMPADSELHLYRERGDSGKYYFFTELPYRSEPSSERLTLLDRLAPVEQVSYDASLYSDTAKPLASRAYLILFYKIPENVDMTQVYKDVIGVEENEYLFKKYVFYYKKSEFEAFSQWYGSQNKQNRSLVNELIKEDLDLDANEIIFFMRLLIKLPFITLDFPAVHMKNFDAYVSDELSKLRQDNRERCESLNQKLIEQQHSLYLEGQSALGTLVDELIYSKVGDVSGLL